MTVYEIDNDDENDNSNDNSLYSQKVCKHIMKFYMPYLPLWTAIIVSKVIPNFERASNVPVESYFNQIKWEVFKGKTKMNQVFVMENLRQNVSDRVQQARLEGMGVRLTSNQKKKENKNNIKQNWQLFPTKRRNWMTIQKIKMLL